MADTKFSVNRGFYSSAFNVTLASDTPGATIRYTLGGKDPTLTAGNTYTGPILISKTTCLRAAAFKAGWKPSNIDSHTYIFPASHPGYQTALNSLPAISLVGDAARTFFYDTTPGATVTSANSGIMAIYEGNYSGDVWVSSGATSFNNPMQRGMAFERPVSAELIQPGRWQRISRGLRNPGAR